MLPFKSLARFAGVLLVGAASSALAHTLASDARAERVAARRHADSLAVREGPGLLAVYVGSSTCPWCLDPRVPPLLQDIHSRMTSLAESLGVGYRMVGLAVDRRPDQGLDHLRRVGPMFAEVSSGGEWQGMAVALLNDAGDPGIVGTPLVVVLRRNVRRIARDSAPPLLLVTDQEILTRIVGLEAIERWVLEGSPIPLVEPPVRAVGSG